MSLILLLACVSAATEGTSSDTGEERCRQGREAAAVVAMAPSGDTLSFADFDGEFMRDGRNWYPMGVAVLRWNETRESSELLPFGRSVWGASDGTYEVHLWAEGYQDWRGQVDVALGDDGQLNTEIVYAQLEAVP